MTMSVQADPELSPNADRAAATRHLATQQERVQGFTLVELLVAVILVGILSAVAIVGLSGVTKSGNKSSCKAVLGAAQSAATTYYANAGLYPPTSGSPPIGFSALVSGTTGATGSPAVLTLPAGVTASGVILSSTSQSWSVTMSGGGTTSPPSYAKTTGAGAPCS